MNRELFLSLCQILKNIPSVENPTYEAYRIESLFRYHPQGSSLAHSCAHLRQKWPLAYCLGFCDWGNLSIRTPIGVLIPRPETEQLVYGIKAYLDVQKRTPNTIWDLCCGSGNISLWFKHQYPQSLVESFDISAVALLNTLSQNSHLKGYQYDLRKPGPWSPHRPDLVIANPPYLSHEEWVNCPQKDQEPRLSLEGGLQGHETACAIWNQLRPQINAQTLIAFEMSQTTTGAFVKHLGKPWSRCFLEDTQRVSDILEQGHTCVAQDWDGRDLFVLWIK